jgi:uncharacterized protein (TIGR00725 family)
MKRSLIIGVMGGGIAEPDQLKSAEKLGALIAKNGWILLNGGRNAGIMEASAKGAAENGGITLGILPDNNKTNMSGYITIPVVTGMGNARNCINVLTSDVIVACTGGAGTLSEIALAIKCNKPVILFNFDPGTTFNKYQREGKLFSVQTPNEVIDKILDIT